VVGLTGITLFVISFLWFCFPGEYVMIANSDLSLFRTSPDYFLSFMNRPGGLLVYLGSFLDQFFRFRIAGALLLAVIVTSAFYSAIRLAGRISDKKGIIIIGAITPILFMGMHNYYPHHLSHSLGFILAMALAAAFPHKEIRKITFLAIAVPIVYLAGGGFVWLFCGLVLAEDVIRSRKVDVKVLLLSILYPALIIMAGASLLFLEPLKELVRIQLPFGPEYGNSPWPLLFSVWIFVYMILAGTGDPWKSIRPLWQTLAGTTVCLAVMVVVLHYSYNRKNAEFFQIEKLAVSEDWDGLLQYTGQHPSNNLFGSFYTNMALMKKGRLCKDLFRYSQAFGRRGLCFEWDSKGEMLKRGGDFYWAVSFVNEAHHWAFESMIVDGFTQRNLKRLIQTELVRGNFKIAGRYIDLLGSSMFQGRLADHYRTFLHNPAAIQQDPELGPRMRLHISNDFFSEGQDLERDLSMLLANDPLNRPAYDYLMALLLLEKKVDKIAGRIPEYLETCNGKLPGLVDESLVVYKLTHKEDQLPDIDVSVSTMQRFREYTRILQQYRGPEDAARMLYPSFQNSFWYYFNFSSLEGDRS